MRLKFKDRSIHIKRTITIGRDKNNDVVINDDPLISRRHATIEKDGPDYYIMDNGSTNGKIIIKYNILMPILENPFIILPVLSFTSLVENYGSIGRNTAITQN